MDTGSYMMSGKTLSDHGLSLAMDQDCSMVRVLDEEEEICQEDPDYEVAVAALRPLPEDSELDLALAAGDENFSPTASYPWDDAGYADLAHRVNTARTLGGTYQAAEMMDPDAGSISRQPRAVTR